MIEAQKKRTDGEGGKARFHLDSQKSEWNFLFGFWNQREIVAFFLFFVDSTEDKKFEEDEERRLLLVDEFVAFFEEESQRIE